jgi:Starter unit:ACP transacylase in aflatoxin biosynthesis
MNVQVFGDQTADQAPLLRKLANRKDNSLLSTFLERSALALRDEIQKLPKVHRKAIPTFITISQLSEAYQDAGSKIPQLESALVTVAQLGHYFGYAKIHQS